jgi:hypothetical protein
VGAVKAVDQVHAAGEHPLEDGGDIEEAERPGPEIVGREIVDPRAYEEKITLRGHADRMRWCGRGDLNPHGLTAINS